MLKNATLRFSNSIFVLLSIIFVVLVETHLPQAVSAEKTSVNESTAVQAKKTLEQVLLKYNSQPSLKIQIKKIDEKKVLGTKTIANGFLSVQKNKFNFTLNGEKHSEIIFDSKNIWLIENPDLDLDPKGKRKVVAIKNKQPAFIKKFSALFSNSKVFFAEYKVSKALSDGKTMTIELNDASKEIKPLTLKVDSVANDIKEVSFVDDVGTTTTVVFEKIEFVKNLSAQLFTYTQKKNDEVLNQ